jgi:lycopene cyclase domain-containing protein
VTYLQFHFVFTLPVLAALALLQGRTREPWWPLALITGIAFVYTTPWDNFLVANEVWTYPPDRVWATIGYVPVEEYAFFVIESVIVGLVVRLLQARWPAEPAAPNRTARVVGAAVFAALSLLGVACVVAGGPWLYLGLIVAWAFPILALMWGLGGHLIWARRRLVAWAVIPTALYLCLADRVAIGLGIWTITDATRTGWEVAGLPFEEGLFFFVTAQLVAQGLVMLERDALPETVGQLRRARPVPA